MFEVKKLTACSFDEGLALWNSGFEGYFADMTFSMDRWLSKFALEGLSPDLSVVGYVDGRAAGFVLSGIRVIQGKKVAWNGGTGVVPQFRGQGIGTQLIAACLEVYRSQGVQIALLEAIARNEPAIRLYSKMGYVSVQRVTFLHNREALAQDAFDSALVDNYEMKLGLPIEVSRLAFYRAFAPWQAQWQSVRDGESILLLDAGEVVGYALFKRIFNDIGDLQQIALYQCEALAGRIDEVQIIDTLLQQVYSQNGAECVRMTVNLPVSNPILMASLAKAGFKTLSEQVYMQRSMEA